MTAPSDRASGSPREPLYAPESAQGPSAGTERRPGVLSGPQTGAQSLGAVGPTLADQIGRPLYDSINQHLADGQRAEQQLDYQRRVLDVFAKADSHGDLLWHLDGEEIRFAALVNDVFAWGGADAEEITPERLPVLEQALADLWAIGRSEDVYLADLYAARIRHMRPQGAAYPERAATQALFDACGPEREIGLGNPRRPPTATP